jgi:autotransporter-associated beta strand protein
MPDGCPPFLPRPPDTGAVCLRRVVVLFLSLLLVASSHAQLTLNRYVGVNQEVPMDDFVFSSIVWTNNGFTNISSVAVNINLSTPDGVEEFWVGGTAALFYYNEGDPNEVIETVYDFDPNDFSGSLNATFNLTNSFTAPLADNEWGVLLDNDTDPNQVGSGQFNYWRAIVTGDAKTNGTIEVGQQGIISASSGYTVNGATISVVGTGANGVTVTNGGSLTFNGGLTGSGDLNKVGSGALFVGGNSTGFSGTMRLNEGSINLTTTTALGTGTLFQTNGSSTAIFSAGGNYNNNMTLANVSFTNGGNTLSGTITNSGSGTFLTAASTTNTISGTMTGSGGLTKDGTGELIIAGSANNTFTGATVVDEGRLVLSNSSGNAIHSSTNITVNTGGTLVLGASDQIGDGVGLILSGGTFLVGAANVTENLGTLTLTADSTIDFGNFGASGLRQLTFDHSASISWTGTLTITNWQGVANTSSEFTEIFFGIGGLSSAQQGQIRFANQGNVAGALLGTGELVPVPEPRVYAAALALLGVVGWRERRRIASILGLKRKF